MQLGGIPFYCGGAFLIGLYSGHRDIGHEPTKEEKDIYDKELITNHYQYIECVGSYALSMTQIIWTNYNMGAYPAAGPAGNDHNPPVLNGTPVAVRIERRSSIPFEVLGFQQILKKLLVMSNYGVLYAVTNSGQVLAKKHLEATGFKIAGRFSKVGGGMCETWFGDVQKDVNPILKKIDFFVTK